MRLGEGAFAGSWHERKNVAAVACLAAADVHPFSRVGINFGTGVGVRAVGVGRPMGCGVRGADFWKPTAQGLLVLVAAERPLGLMMVSRCLSILSSAF